MSDNKITALLEITTPAQNDYVPVVDVDDTTDFATGSNRKIQVSNLLNKTLVTKTANYSVTSADNVILVDATSGSVTVTLPTAIGISGKQYIIKKVDASTNTVTIATTFGQKIDGNTTLVLPTQYLSYTVISDGGSWKII